MLVSQVALPTRTQAPVSLPQTPAPIAETPPVVSTATPDPAVAQPESATSRTEIQIRMAFEFGVRLSFDGAVAGRGDHEGAEAYEDDHDEDDDRMAKLAKGMTKALGHAIHQGLKAFFGDEDNLSKADRKELKALEHELKHALKDAFKSNREDDQVDLLGFATDALGAVQDFAQGFGEFFAGAFPQLDGGASDGGGGAGAGAGSGDSGGPAAAAVPDPFVGVSQGPTLVNTVEPTAPVADVAPALPVDPSDAPVSNAAAPIDPSLIREGQGHEHSHRFDFGRIFGGRDPQASFTRVNSLLERITAQLQDMVDALQPDDETDAPVIVDPSAPNVDPNAPATTDPNRDPVVSTPVFAAQMEFSASFSFAASINLVA